MRKQTPIAETIGTDAEAKAARDRLAELRGESERWRAERERVTIARGEMLATGSTASLAEAGRLSAKVSMGDADESDRAQIIAALSGRLARWEAGAAARDRDVAETALGLAAHVARDAEDAVAAAAIALVSALADLDAADRDMMKARKAAGKAGAVVELGSPANGRKLLHALLESGRSAAVVHDWLQRARTAHIRHPRTPPARRRYTPPPGKRHSTDAATLHGIPAGTYRIVTEQRGPSAA
jgi:hypothetical protein